MSARDSHSVAPAKPAYCRQDVITCLSSAVIIGRPLVEHRAGGERVGVLVAEQPLAVGEHPLLKRDRVVGAPRLPVGDGELARAVSVSGCSSPSSRSRSASTRSLPPVTTVSCPITMFMTFCLQNYVLRNRVNQPCCPRSPAPGEPVQRVAARRQLLHERQRKSRLAEPRRRLGQQPPDPARGGSIKPRVFGLCENGEDRQRIVKPDGRQLGRGRLDDLPVARREGALQAAVR